MAITFSTSSINSMANFPFPIRKGDVTIMFWMKRATNGDGVIFYFESPTQTSVLMRCLLESGQLGINFGSGGNKYGSSLTIGKWYHVACYFSKYTNNASSNTYFLYLNGKQDIASGATYIYNTMPTDDLCNFFMGWAFWTTNPASDFSYSAFKVFKGKLSPGEIRREMYSNAPVKRYACIFWLPLESESLSIGSLHKNKMGHGITKLSNT